MLQRKNPVPLVGGNRAGTLQASYAVDIRQSAPNQACKIERTNVFVGEYLSALCSTQFASLKPLITAGVSWQTITNAVPAHALISFSTINAFAFDDGGGSAFIVPVRVESAVTPEAADPVEAIRDGWIVDLVAFHPAHPGRWALRSGAAEWLGVIELQYLDPEPVPVWRTPLRWLQSGCRGLVLLSKERGSQYRILSGLGAIVAEDYQHATQLRGILAHPWSAPRVLLGREEARDAA